jgi:PhnB protein
MAIANPYLNFPGNCQEAFTFYKSVFGGEFSNVTKFSEMPADPSMPDIEVDPDQIAHMSLPLGDSTLMGSDVPPSMGTVTQGNSTYICLTPDSVEDAEKQFGALCEGGQVEMAFGKQVWGDYFGSCTDRYGIRWMVDVSDPVPGRRHDSVALDLVGWGYQIRAATDHNPHLAVFGDSAYSRHTDWTPLKKLKDVERTPQDTAFNRAIASFRAPVERAIGLLKQWKILATGYRGRLTELPTIIHVIVNLEFYRLAS